MSGTDFVGVVVLLLILVYVLSEMARKGDKKRAVNV